MWSLVQSKVSTYCPDSTYCVGWTLLSVMRVKDLNQGLQTSSVLSLVSRKFVLSTKMLNE